DGQSDQPVGAPGDVPGQRPAEAPEAELPVGVVGDRLAVEVMADCLLVRPGHEVLDPCPDGRRLQGTGTRPFASHVVGLAVEQQMPVGDHALQDADGVDDRGDGHPGNLALGACGPVVAVLVDGGLELKAANQVSAGPPVAAPGRVGAAAGAQAEDLPGAHTG